MGAYKIGSPYEVAGVWYYPKADYNYRESGIASWYGPGFHGRKTANGEIYDQKGLTAAHRTLPMPSMVRVTNLENGRSIKVRINDRGPFKNGRIIDLSLRGADLLGFRRNGTAKVRVEIVEDESRRLASAALNDEASKRAPDPVPRVPVTVETLPPSGGSVTPAAGATRPTASQTASVAPLDTSAIPRHQISVPEPDGVISTAPVQPSQIFVQAGSFTQVANARKLRARLTQLGKARIAQTMIDNRRFFRVRFGPLSSVEEADKLLAVLIGNGHTDSRVVVD